MFMSPVEMIEAVEKPIDRPVEEKPIDPPIEAKPNRLSELRRLRDEFVVELKNRIEEVRRERAEMVAQYDEELGELENELFMLGIRTETTDRPSEAGVKAFNYLKENRGKWFASGAIMTAIRSEGTVAAIALRPFLESGQVQKRGERRYTQYAVLGLDDVQAA